VSIKLGMTMDAKIALESGASKWITSPAARADVQRLRAASDAIVTGAGTVVADDPALTVRDQRFDTGGRQPLRVILDSDLRVPPSSRIFCAPGETLVFTASETIAAAEALRIKGVSIEQCPRNVNGLDLATILRRLGEREVNEVLVEAGPAVAGAFMQSGLFDELVLYMAPKIFGARARDAFQVPPPLSLDTAAALDFVDVRRVGSDLRITLRPRR
jgi:diaminohydroxyphosphoribosylaminopyrimidine deaminase/5-amino-6-(5-phosphoribosylamino)uracil reductase